MTKNKKSELDREIDIILGDEAVPLLELDHYCVAVLELGPEAEGYTDGRFVYKIVYGVINTDTEVLEHVCAQYPEACFMAVSLNAAVEKSPWTWSKDVAEAAESAH